jgi:hypothetical protein
MPDEPDPDAPYADARSLARCASRLPPREMASRAQRFLTNCRTLIAAAPRPTVLRKGYHRAAAAAALVGVAASVQAGDQTIQWAAAAEHARAAGDGPLLAELWLIRSVEDGAAAHAREIGSPVAMRHILAAQSVVGASAFARCWAHLALANEWALDGEATGRSSTSTAPPTTPTTRSLRRSPRRWKMSAPGSPAAAAPSCASWAGGRTPRPPSKSHGPEGLSATCTSASSGQACGLPPGTRTRRRRTSPQPWTPAMPLGWRAGSRSSSPPPANSRTRPPRGSSPT